ncbi:MAG: pyruvate synthase [Limnochordaceae bacterium]|nr:pyruvate synthase [Limnochordaceae bacterium]
MAVVRKEELSSAAPQTVALKTGNEMAALAANQINYHIMGYYPITPSTEIAEFLDEMKAEGKNTVHMIEGDGEHGAAGICYGASTAGGRVFNATSSQGLLYSLEQLPVQSGTRFPMVLDLVTRTISGPLDIRGDHSDLNFAVHTGWVILLARDPQAVYDMNIIAVRVGEHPDVLLPVIVAYDGFFTSHQKRRVEFFSDNDAVQRFIGQRKQPYVTIDPRHPISVGGYMNDPDLINNHYQHKLAMDRAYQVIPQIFAEWAELTGRQYPLVDLYRMDDAEVAVFLINSAAETAKDVVDRLRAQGYKVGVISPNILRPFPIREIQQALRNVKALVIGERADSVGGYGGSISHEVKSALKDDPSNRTLVATRIFGLGGKDFYDDEAESFFRLGLEIAHTGKVEIPYDYSDVTPGDPAQAPVQVLEPLRKEDVTLGLTSVEKDEETGQLKVRISPPRALTERPKRIVSGHGACPGCGIFSGVDQFLKGIEGDVVILFQTGCGYVVSTGYPYSSHRVTFIHNLFQNGAATLSGVVDMFEERQRRGEIPAGEDITFIMVTGDGGMDIGMGPAIGTALRNHHMIILEYDNEGYMNTGSQMSYSTPLGNMTSTSHIGPAGRGKSFQHKDTPQIMAATNIPYVFTGVEAFNQDLVRKAAKAQWYAKHEGLAYGKILSACPLNWRSPDDMGTKIVETAVNCCFFPLYEVEHGITTITYNPEEKGKRVPVTDWLKMMGKTKHLLKPEYADELKAFSDEVERRWVRLKARHESPVL